MLRKSVVILSLALAVTIYADEVKIPFGKEPMIDGKLNEDEWQDAVKKNGKWTNPAGQAIEMTVYFKHNETHLFVGLESSDPGIASIFVKDIKDNLIHVMHSSFALGEARYKFDKDKSQWKLEKKFQFQDFHRKIKEHTDKGESKDEAREIAAEEFEKANGWRSNFLTEEDQNVSQFEFRIAYSMIGIDPSKIKPKDHGSIPVISIVIGLAGQAGKVTLPHDVKDGCTNINIHMGDDIPQMKFDPKTWWQITSSDNWLKPKDKDKEKENEVCEKPNQCHDIHIEAIGTCSSCKKEIPNRCDKYCEDCAKKSGVCRLCGKKIK